MNYNSIENKYSQIIIRSKNDYDNFCDEKDKAIKIFHEEKKKIIDLLTEQAFNIKNNYLCERVKNKIVSISKNPSLINDRLKNYTNGWSYNRFDYFLDRLNNIEVYNEAININKTCYDRLIDFLINEYVFIVYHLENLEKEKKNENKAKEKEKFDNIKKNIEYEINYNLVKDIKNISSIQSQELIAKIKKTYK